METLHELLENLDKIHTTDMGIIRLKKNLSLNTDDVVAWCKSKVQSSNCNIVRNGKNWYAEVDGYVITINASSYTVITAHKQKY